jgi:MFS family permease
MAEPQHDAYAALRHANYLRFASGFLLSSTGLQMLTLAVSWEVWERTKDPLHSGYIGLARALPVILLALPAGYLIDSFDRRKVLAITQFAFAAVVLGLAVASYTQAPLWMTYVLLALSGCARVFNGPSRATLLPQLVPMTDFHNATSWNSGVFQLSAFGGPILAGIMLEVWGVAWPVYVITAVACVLFGLLSLTLVPRSVARNTESFSWKGITAGMSHLWTEKTILAAITLDLFAVLLGGATALLPMFAETILKVGPIGLGILKASTYVGAFLMALYLAHRPAFTRAGPALLWSVAAFGISIIIFGLSENLWLSAAALAIGGAVDNVSVVIRHVLVQVRTPEYLRGRVSSVNSVFIESSNEIGAFESGLVAAAFGPVVSVVSGGLGTLVVVGLVAGLIPQIRKLGRLDDTPPPEAAPATTNADEGK